MRAILGRLCAALMVVTLSAADCGDSATEPGTQVNAEDFAGTWSGTVSSIVKYGTQTETHTGTVTLSLVVAGGAVSGISRWGTDSATTITGVSLVDGTLSFGFVNTEPDANGGTDCAPWNLKGSAVLNAAKTSMTLTLSGSVCSPGGIANTIAGLGTLNKR